MTTSASSPTLVVPLAGFRTRGAASVRRLVRGREDDAVWVRPALVALLGGTGVLYLWDLSASGWANAFYSAAAQAGSQSWEAFFYGSSDAGNSITVDKPPAALWVTSLSVRLFGLSSWSILVPQALIGVATVGVLYLAVRRVVGPGAALLAGAAMAVTPVAVLMFRYNNPDALLVLLLTAAAYALTRGLEKAGGRWLALAGVLVGTAFLTKMLQALLVVPAFALVYLCCAPTTLRRRVLHLLGAGLALLVSGGWWVAVVEAVPASMRPYIGGSQTNSVWELIWGYNGLGRITGNETGSVGGASGWGITGLGRLVNGEIGGQVAWLLPAAVILTTAGLLAAGRAPRTDLRRAALLMWAGWLLVTYLVFSLMAGIFHAYYTVALAPAIAALVGIGGAMTWRRRGAVWARVTLAATLAVTVAWSFALLHRSFAFLPTLLWLVLVAGLLAAVALLMADRMSRVVLATTLAVGVLAGLAGPGVFALDTARTPHQGSIPTAGPAFVGPRSFVGPHLGPNQAFRNQFPGLPTGTAVLPRNAGGLRFGGGLLNARRVSDRTAAALAENASHYTWVAAVTGANNAAGYQLATQLPVMPLGGFNGSDPSPTLAEFQQYVADGRVHWFIAGGLGGGRAPQQITAWVERTFAAQAVGGVTMYDLTRPLR
jgi:4-amino-4-deoxy-L-arabinose transferase-like glycosyltransferase